MSKIILFQGDSITDAHRSREDEQYAGTGYPTLVKARLGAAEPAKYAFYNRGISGNRIVDLYARIKSDIINLKPDYLSILIGVNDVWHELDRQNGVDAGKFARIYSMLVDEIQEALPDCRIMLLEPFVLEGRATCVIEEQPDRWENFRREVALRAQAVREVAAQHGLPCASLQPVFDEACKKAEASYWLMDGVHPTAMGHELIAQAWMNTFEGMR